MRTRIDEISAGVYRIANHTPDAGEAGLLYNQFLIAADRPMLFHTGQPYMFDAVRDAVAQVLDPARVAFICAGHASRPDEFGSLDRWLALAPPRSPCTPRSPSRCCCATSSAPASGCGHYATASNSTSAAGR